MNMRKESQRRQEVECCAERWECGPGILGNGGGYVRGSGPRGRGGTEPRSSSNLGPGVSLGPLLTQLVLVPNGMKIAPRIPLPKAQLHVALFVLEASILNICLSFRARQDRRHQWTGKGAEVLSHFVSGFLRLGKHMLAGQMNECHCSQKGHPLFSAVSPRTARKWRVMSCALLKDGLYVGLLWYWCLKIRTGFCALSAMVPALGRCFLGSCRCRDHARGTVEAWSYLGSAWRETLTLLN